MTLRVIPTAGLDPAAQLLLTTETLNQVVKGRGNNTGTVTLTANAASTVVADNQFESSMVPALTPTTANAAAALATTYVSARAYGSFTLTHANNAQTDKTFLYTRRG